MKTPTTTKEWRRGDGHIANRSAQPAATGRLSIDPHRDTYGDARHHGAAGDGHAHLEHKPGKQVYLILGGPAASSQHIEEAKLA